MKTITLARKPLVGTVAKNVLEYGCGGLNIEGTRIGTEGGRTNKGGYQNSFVGGTVDYKVSGVESNHAPKGRWTANVILNEKAAEVLDEQSGVSVSSGGRTANISKTSKIYGGGKGLGQDLDPDLVKGDPGFGDIGGASRFFKQIGEDK